MCRVSLVAASRLLHSNKVTSLIAGLEGTRAQLPHSGAQAELPHGTWNLLRPGIEPVSPALAGGFFITGPPGKSGDFLKE